MSIADLERAYNTAVENLEEYSDLWFRVARSRGFFLLWKDNPNFEAKEYYDFAAVMKRALGGDTPIERVLCGYIDAVVI